MSADLREIMRRVTLGGKPLTRVTVAQLVKTSASTVDAWLLDEKSEHHRRMPQRSLRLLALELGIEKPVAAYIDVKVE